MAYYQSKPTIYNVGTGEWEEVTEEEALGRYGIPIGPPRTGEFPTGPHDIPSGGPEYPGGPTPSFYPGPHSQRASTGGMQPQLFASTEAGVPAGYQTEESVLLGGREEEEEEEEETPEQAASTGYGTLPQGMTLTDPNSAYALPQGMKLLDESGKPIEPKEPTPPEEYDVPHYGDLYPSIAQQRARLVEEIDNNPALREFAAAAISQEGRGQDTVQAIVESLFNRTVQRKSSIQRQLTNGFYGPVNTGRVDAIIKRGVEPWMYEQFDQALEAVRNGSDLIEGRTDQGQYDEIIGPKTKYGSEYFGYMGGDPTWSLQHQETKGDPGPATRKGRGEEAGLPPGMKILKEGEEDTSAGLPPGMKLIEERKEGEPQGGLDAAIAEAKDAGLTVTSGYRGPEHELSKKHPRSAHTQGLAFDLRARTGEEADAVIAKQREIFASRGMQEGRDYKFIDEVRNPSGHATGPHVHVQMTEGGLGYYSGKGEAGLPPGMKLVEEEEETAGLPPGMKLVEGEAAPVPAPALTTMQTLPSGEMAPTAATGQEGVRAGEQMAREPIEETTRTPLPEVSASVARQMGLERWIDQDIGMEVRRAQMAEGGLPIAARAPVTPREPSLGINVPSKVERPEFIPGGRQPEPVGAEAAKKREMISFLSGKEIRKEQTDDIVDAVNSLARGATSDGGLVSTLEGGYDLVYQHTKNIPSLKFIADNAKSNRDAAAAMRERIREGTPVDKDFQESIGGQVFTGLGQLANAPIYIGATAAGGPLAGVAAGGVMALGQLWQEKKDELKATAERTGKPISDDDANKMAWQYVAVAAPIEALGDKLLFDRFLKSQIAKKATIGTVLKEGGKGFLSEGSTESAQTAWGNAVDILNKLDPDRKITDGTLTSFIVGGTVGFVGGGAATALRKPETTGEKRIGPIFPKEVARTAALLTAEPTAAPAEAPKEAAPAEAPAAPKEAAPQQRRIAEINNEINEITKKETPEEGDAKKIGDLVQEGISLSEQIAEAEKPVEPTKEVVTTKSNRVTDAEGKKGQVTREEAGMLTVDWEDDTTTTVNEGDVNRRESAARTEQKNVVQLSDTGKKGVTLEHYNGNGKRVVNQVYIKRGNTKEQNLAEATAKAEAITKKQNITGYYDQEDNFVRTTEAPPAAAPTAVTQIPQPVSQRAPGALVPALTAPSAPVAAPTAPGEVTYEEEALSPEQIASFNKFSKWVGAKKETAKASVSAFLSKERQWQNMSLRDAVTIFHDKGWNRLFENKFDYLRRQGATQGIPIEYRSWDDPEMERSPVMVLSEPGKEDVLLINPSRLGAMIEAARDVGGDKAANRVISGLLSEEHLHAAENVADQNAFNALPAAEKARHGNSWRRFQIAKYTKIIKETKRAALGGGVPRRDAKGIGQALKDAWNLYYANLDEPLIGQRYAFTGRPEDIFDFLLDHKGELTHAGINFMPEWIRQLAQQKMQGRLTEQTYVYISNKIRQWVRDAIRRIRRLAAAAPSGALGDELAQTLQDIESVIFSAEELRMAEQYSHVQSVKQGTQQYKEWAGNSVLIDPKTGINKTVYHATQGDFDEFKQTKDLGYHFGTIKAAWDRALALGADDFNEEQWNIMPMTLRLETPVYLPDLGQWQPERVLRELEHRGYIDDADWLRDFWGPEMSNQDIVGHLQEKGYDGIIYRNSMEGLRTLSREEAEEKKANLTIKEGTINGVKVQFAYDKDSGDILGAGHTPEDAREDMVRMALTLPRAWDDSYIVFTGNQAKSAAGNEGAYSREDSRVTKAKEPSAPSLESIAVEEHNRSGGSSINAAHGELAGREFYSVGVFPELNYPVPGKELVIQDWADFRDKLVQAGLDPNSSNKTIGTWYNDKTGNSEFDVSATVTDLRAALEIAREYNQEAIFDHLTGGVIYVNGVMPGVGGLPSVSARSGFIGAKSVPSARDTWPIFKPRLTDPYSFTAENLPPGKIESVSIISDEAITESAKRGQEWKDWYTTYDNFMRWLTAKHPDYRPLYAWWFAATSPHNLVGANITASMKAFRNFVETGDPSVPAPGRPGFMRTHWPNLKRTVGLPSGAVTEPTAVGGGIIGGGVGLTGGKVPEFAPALLGDPYAIAVDMHVASVLFGTENPTEWQRFAGQLAIARVAKRMGWSPAEVQAALFADDIIKKDGVMARAEKYMEKYESEFLKLIEADQAAGGKGAGIGRSILERAGARIGPERLFGTTAENIQSIREARKASIEIKIDPEIAQSISLRGSNRAKAAKGAPGSGRSAKGVPTTAFNRRVQHGWSGRHNLYQGSKYVFWNSPGLRGVGNAIHQLQDLRSKYTGEFINPIIQYEREMWDVPEWRPILKSAANQHQEYRLAKANGQPLPKLTEQAKKLRDVVDNLMAKVNSKNAAVGIRINDPFTGKLVPIPAVDYPTVIKNEILEAMRSPHMYKETWNQIRDGLKAEGIVNKNASDVEVENYIDKVLRAHSKNGPFSQFFFNPKLLPKTSYDYSYRGMGEFLQAWTEKIAQAESLGKNPDNDIFEYAIENTHNPESKDYLRSVKALAYGNVINDVWGRFSMVAGLVASLKHIAGPIVATKNWIGGQVFNAAHFGLINFTKAFFLSNPFRAVNDAFELGILTRDIMNISADGEKIQGGVAGAAATVTRAVSQRGYYYSGYKGAENWVRGVSMRAGESLLRDAVRKYKKKPRGDKTLRYMAYFRKLGISDPDALLREGGRGPITDEYLRAAVIAVQGGYTFADVPVYMETPVGRFLFKYQKWGIEQVGHFMRHFAAPAARGLRLQKPETLTLPDAYGNEQEVEVPRSVAEMLPLARYLVMLTVAAAGQEWLLEQLFGLHPKTMRIAEALARFRVSNWEGFKAVIDKIWNWHLSVGSLGSMGKYIQSGLSFAGLQAEQPRQALVESMPSLDPFLGLWDQFQIAIEQKGFTEKNLADALMGSAFIRGYAQASASPLARDVFGMQHRYSETIAAKQDLALAKQIQRRYEEETKYPGPKTVPMGRREKEPKSKWRDKLDEALLVGDADTARQILDGARALMRGPVWEAELKSLKAHIREKQPIQAAGGSEAARVEFRAWARENLTIYDQATIERLETNFRGAAKQLGVGIEFKPASLEDVMEHRQNRAIKEEAAALSF